LIETLLMEVRLPSSAGSINKVQAGTTLLGKPAVAPARMFSSYGRFVRPKRQNSLPHDLKAVFLGFRSKALTSCLKTLTRQRCLVSALS
jgi:hypothetical protein